MQKISTSHTTCMDYEISYPYMRCVCGISFSRSATACRAVTFYETLKKERPQKVFCELSFLCPKFCFCVRGFAIEVKVIARLHFAPIFSIMFHEMYLLWTASQSPRQILPALRWPCRAAHCNTITGAAKASVADHRRPGRRWGYRWRGGAELHQRQ